MPDQRAAIGWQTGAPASGAGAGSAVAAAEAAAASLLAGLSRLLGRRGPQEQQAWRQFESLQKHTQQLQPRQPQAWLGRAHPKADQQPAAAPPPPPMIPPRARDPCPAPLAAWWDALPPPPRSAAAVAVGDAVAAYPSFEGRLRHRAEQHHPPQLTKHRNAPHAEQLQQQQQQAGAALWGAALEPSSSCSQLLQPDGRLEAGGSCGGERRAVSGLTPRTPEVPRGLLLEGAGGGKPEQPRCQQLAPTQHQCQKEHRRTQPQPHPPQQQQQQQPQQQQEQERRQPLSPPSRPASTPQRQPRPQPASPGQAPSPAAAALPPRCESPLFTLPQLDDLIRQNLSLAAAGADAAAPAPTPAALGWHRDEGAAGAAGPVLLVQRCAAVRAGPRTGVVACVLDSWGQPQQQLQVTPHLQRRLGEVANQLLRGITPETLAATMAVVCAEAAAATAAPAPQRRKRRQQQPQHQHQRQHQHQQQQQQHPYPHQHQHQHQQLLAELDALLADGVWTEALREHAADSGGDGPGATACGGPERPGDAQRPGGAGTHGSAAASLSQQGSPAGPTVLTRAAAAQRRQQAEAGALVGQGSGDQSAQTQCTGSWSPPLKRQRRRLEPAEGGWGEAEAAAPGGARGVSWAPSCPLQQEGRRQHQQQQQEREQEPSQPPPVPLPSREQEAQEAGWQEEVLQPGRGQRAQRCH
ncbi:hypothetical protein Rsub_08258 [Raphidocelis subcapitata]|uniref:Uncharacterized protein n=1 Tax=Raphidocelis subcapitata TaxID=307507 RepID=A0A2V0PA48_9CHLO|nr:hypothetical protein Rsub_08258 [Raphidocelis subcapitata]|eukprot:GBF95822.1 hypothetical protein Rsub_08258 [Raphidocelis subcapitata]